MSDSLDDRLCALTEVYVGQLPQRVGEIEDVYRRIRSDPSALSEYEQLRLLVHRLAGSGATFGFDRITVDARSVEAHIRRMVEEGLPPPGASGAELHTLIETLKIGCRSAAPEEQMRKTGKTQQGGVDAAEDAPVRRIVFLARQCDGSVKDLAAQLGFFGFSPVFIDSISDLAELAAENPNQSVIVHSPFLDSRNGYQEALSGLKRAYPKQLSYVFISERSDFAARLGAVRAGGDAFFIMPVDVSRLIDTVDALINQGRGEPYHVLIVDDDQEQVSFYALLLQQAGMITSVASDPKTVLNVLVEAKPELILMDLYMPGCSGTELLSIIRQQEAFVSIPVVFLSVESSEERRLAAIRRGGDDYISKPADPDFLVAAISNRIQRSRNMRYFMERDSLTGLLNHSNLNEQLIRETMRADRAGSDLCFAMLDLDHFKNVNDSYGHLTGDKVLKSLSRILQERLRRTDVIGRYGGEEFGVILLNTSFDHAFRILDEVRENFSHIRHQAESEEFFVTLSCGIAGYSGYGDAHLLTAAADRALYEAKEQGRNRTVVAGTPDVDPR